MNNKKSIIPRLIVWLLALAALTAIVLVFVRIYSQKENKISDPAEVLSYSGDGEKLIMENDDLLFEMDGATSQFRLTVKKNGEGLAIQSRGARKRSESPGNQQGFPVLHFERHLYQLGR